MFFKKEKEFLRSQTAAEKAEMMVDEFKAYFLKKAKDFVISDVDNDVNHAYFGIDFIVYDYYPIRMNYSRGAFGCCIGFGDYGVGLYTSQERKDLEQADIQKFLKEVDEQIKLRIPDKYLKAKGWD